MTKEVEQNVIRVQPQVNVTDTARGSRTEGSTFDQVVSWPIAQSAAVGAAGFLATYTTSNYFQFSRVWVALSESPNTQLSMWVGGLSFCAACLVFFMLDEVGWLFRQMGTGYAATRRAGDLSGLERRIDELENVITVRDAQIVELRRENAVLQATAARGSSQPIKAQPEPTYQPTARVATHADDVREYMQTHYGEQPADAGTLAEMEQARKILLNAYQHKTIARNSCMKYQQMSRADWETGVQFLRLNGAVGDVPPRGFELLVDAKQALDVMDARARNRASKTANNFVAF